MVVTILEDITKSLFIKNKQKAVIDVGELFVPTDDFIIPSKLRLLAEAGWSIVDAEKTDSGFSLVLMRKTD